MIEIHETELAANRGLLEELIEQFYRHEIKDRFGFNFTEWIQQPKDTIDRQIDAVLRWRGEEVKSAEKQTGAIENSMNKELGGKHP